ncbi:hypothetical protein CP533_0599 [Ophiocordyceps camponoti-saundersi (nom. inval.)]|nr:hypothetical protein CP533_0599 [Ophiocordyceps camponoti-saundersi (nom. inval.)]
MPSDEDRHRHERTPLLRPDQAVTTSSSEAVAFADPPSPSPPLTNGGGVGNGVGENGNDDDDERTIVAKQLPLSRLAFIMGTAWLGVFLGAIDSTVIATLSASIASEFKSLSLLSWLATAYLISTAACQPISGRLTDIFGRGPGLIFSNIFFAAGNLICGLAQDDRAMIAGRVIAGIGGGGLMSISTFLGSDLIPLRNRGIAQGIGNICYGSGAMLGSVFGGLINDHTRWGWRLAFLIQVPPVIFSAIAAAFLIKVPPKQSNKSLLARIDFGGVLLTTSFLVLLLLGLNSGGNQVSWTHPLPLVTIPLSLVVFAGFLWWEGTARQPIIPVRLLLSRTVLAACVCNLLCTMVVMAGIFHVPLYLQVLGDTPTGAGLKMLPSPLGVSIFSVAAGYLMKRTGRYYWLGISGMLIFILGVVIFTLQGKNQPLWQTSVAFFFVGGGYGAMLTVTLLACVAAVDHSQQAVVTSGTYLARSVGGTVGVTVGSAVYQNILKASLWAKFGDLPGAAEEIRRIRNDLGELKRLPEGWYDGVIDSFMEAFRGVWLVMLVVAAAALLSISMMRHHTLHATLERR